MVVYDAYDCMVVCDAYYCMVVMGFAQQSVTTSCILPSHCWLHSEALPAPFAQYGKTEMHIGPCRTISAECEDAAGSERN
jgi:hypothetical protein